jgi:hypothetical protein
MSTRSGGFFGSSETRGAKPAHPDAGRWVMAVLSLGVVVVAVWGPRVAWWLTRHNARWDHYVRTHLRLLGLTRQGFTDAACCFVAITALGLLWALIGTLQWRWRVRRVRGQYWTLVLPRPHGRAAAPRANPVEGRTARDHFLSGTG